MMSTLNDQEKRNNAINELNTNQAELIKKALAETDLKKRFKLYNQARVLRRIAEECQKWETFTKGF